MHQPNRMCVACRQVKPKTELIRIVALNTLTVDKAQKLQGRGGYLCKAEKCIDKAYKKNLFYYKLRQKIEPPLYEELKRLIDE